MIGGIHTSKSRLNVGLTLVVSFLYWFSLYIYVPTLPTYVSIRSSNLAMVGIVLSMYGLWQAVIRIPIGISVDATGRGKPYIIGGLILSAIGAMVMSFGGSVPVLAAGRALTGLAAGTWVPLIIIFSSFYPPKEAVFATSLLTFFGSLGRMLSTGANGLLINWGGYSLAFYFAAGAALLAIFLISVAPIERRAPGKPSLKTLFELLFRRDVLFPTLISTVVMFGTWAVTFSFLPLLAEEIGAGDVIKGLIISLNIAAVTIGNLLNTLTVRKIDQRIKLLFSVMLFGIGIAVAALAPTVGFLFAATFIMGLGNGLTYPTLLGMSIRHVAQNRRTTAMGIHQSVYAIGMFTGPWLGGMLADIVGMRVMFSICAAGCVGTAYILIFFSLNTRRIS